MFRKFLRAENDEKAEDDEAFRNLRDSVLEHKGFLMDDHGEVDGDLEDEVNGREHYKLKHQSFLQRDLRQELLNLLTPVSLRLPKNMLPTLAAIPRQRHHKNQVKAGH